jgi:hypothetical protein
MRPAGTLDATPVGGFRIGTVVFGGALVARSRARVVAEVDNVGARGLVNGGGPGLGRFVAVLDGFRGSFGRRLVLEPMAGSFRGSSVASNSRSSFLRLTDEAMGDECNRGKRDILLVAGGKMCEEATRRVDHVVAIWSQWSRSR